MMKFFRISLSAFTLALLICSAASAETRYISDMLVVTLRSNETTNYEILDRLVTATPVEVLEEDNNFVKVRTEKGLEGYIRKQYVTKEIPKSLQISELEKQKAELEKQLQQLQESIRNNSNTTVEDQENLKKANADLLETRQKLAAISKDYEQLQKQSGNVINLVAERDKLLEENNQINKELSVLVEENRNFHRSNMIQWFLAGGGVFFVGWLVGKLSRKKRGFGRY